MTLDLREITELVRAEGQSLEEFKQRYDSRLENIEIEMTKGKMPHVFGGGNSSRVGSTPDSVKNAFHALLAGDQQKADQYFAEVKGMSAGVSADGGYTVIPTFSDTMTRVMGQISPISRLARTINLEHGLSFEEVIDRDQAPANWVSETQSRVDTLAPQLGLFRVECGELCVMPKATQTRIDASSVDIVGWLTEKVSESFAVTESATFHTGNGIGKPRGILDYTTAATPDSSRAWGTVQHIATTASGAFPTGTTSINPADPLISTIGTLKAQYRDGACWMMNRSTAAVIRQIKDVTGRYPRP